jgi:hypothetical protein
MAALPMPYDSGFVTVSVLGVVPDVLEDRACLGCCALLMVVYVGYSTATGVIDVEQAGLCVVCDSLVLSGPANGGLVEDVDESFWDDDDSWGF